MRFSSREDRMYIRKLAGQEQIGQKFYFVLPTEIAHLPVLGRSFVCPRT